MATGALNQKSLLIEQGTVWAGDDAGSAVDLGSVENVIFTAEQSRFQRDSDNRGTILTQNRLNGIANFDWLEGGDMDNIDELFKGLVTLSSTAGTPTTVTTEALGTGWTVGQPIKLANKNGDNSEVTSIVIDAAGTPLTLNTDYAVYVGDGVNGSLGYTYITPITAQAGILDADYSYTPNAKKTITGGSLKTSTPRYIKIVGPSADDATKKRTIVCLSATPDNDLVLPFLDIERAQDIGVISMVMRNDKGSLWTIDDEINPT